jgi:DHA1 family bicyclomycin/chloramphenicol resistance-like MFS transporter
MSTPSPEADATRATPAFIALLAALTATGPVSMQIFLPSLPLVAGSLATTPGVAQMTLSLSMVATALATLAYGPLSDRFGRRHAMFGGLGLLAAGSLLCTVAGSIEWLIAGRLVQSAGGAAGMVLCRAIARDRFGAAGSARVVSQLMLVMVVAPMLAPAVGGMLADGLGWRAPFVLMLLCALALAAWTRSALPESLPARTTHAGMWDPFRALPSLLRSPAFAWLALQTAFTSTIFFAFVSGAPYLMAHLFNRPATEYGFYFVMVSGGFMVGNLLALRFGRHLSLRTQRVAGAWLALSGPLLLAAIVALDALTPLWLFLPMFLGSIGSGIVMPNAQAAAINVFPQRAGSASGITGFLQMAFAATASQLVGIFTGDSPWPMLVAMLAGGVAALLAAVMQRDDAAVAVAPVARAG